MDYEEKYVSLQEEAASKTKKLKELWKQLQAANNEVKYIQYVQYEQYQQCEQYQQYEQYEQYVQYEQYEQYQQYEQYEQYDQYVQYQQYVWMCILVLYIPIYVCIVQYSL